MKVLWNRDWWDMLGLLNCSGMVGAPCAFSDIMILSISTVGSSTFPDICADSTMAKRDFCVIPVVKDIKPCIISLLTWSFFSSSA
jgi:hypothetical protein